MSQLAGILSALVLIAGLVLAAGAWCIWPHFKKAYREGQRAQLGMK